MKANKKNLVMSILGIFLIVALAATARSLVQAGTQDVIPFVRHDVAEGHSWESAHSADLNGDGLQDLVALNDDYSLNWWENDGTPGDGGWTMRVVDGYFPDASALCVTDLDRDNDLDVLGAESGISPETAWWENDGSPEDGGWTKHIIDSVLDTSDVIATDLDGDNDLDIIAASYTAGVFVWWENDGTPTDGGWTQHLIADGFSGPSAVVAADLNDDMYPDIVGAVAGDYFEGDGLIIWWQSDGTPSDGGWTSHVLATNYALASDVQVTDLDSDHDPDVLAVGVHMYEFRWWENSGDGSFMQHNLVGDFEYAHALSANDLDGDGDTDVSASSTTDGLVWWENDGHETFTRYPIDIANGWISVHAVDIDNDVDLDLLTNPFSGDYVAWWEQISPPTNYAYLPVVLRPPSACPGIQVGQWDGIASFTVPEDRTRVLDFTLDIDTACGSGTLYYSELKIIECGITFPPEEDVAIWGEAQFVSETQMDGTTSVSIGTALCFQRWHSYWISSQAGE